MKKLLEYFTKGTEQTKTGGAIGMEIETDFLMEDGTPISKEISQILLHKVKGRPLDCELKLELGRQKLELSIQPQQSIQQLVERAENSLNWLYRKAQEFGAYPYFAPVLSWDSPLLLVQEDRDAVWVELDGRVALEHLCRCSSIQFTVDVNPYDAIYLINKLWRSKLHKRDYDANEVKWRKYLRDTRAQYRFDRFAGPCSFSDMEDYVNELSKHDVVMHKGKPVRMNVNEISDLNIDLFLRSVWWHYRLRRYGNVLAIEMRPFARRHDDDFLSLWNEIARVIGV